jgi:hypothetical protein
MKNGMIRCGGDWVSKSRGNEQNGMKRLGSGSTTLISIKPSLWKKYLIGMIMSRRRRSWTGRKSYRWRRRRMIMGAT